MSLKDLLNPDGGDADEVVREGAAIDGAQAEGDFAGLPRMLRYALMPDAAEVNERVAADVTVLAPDLSVMVAAWASSARLGWPTLAAVLDEAAVRIDEPILRALADVVRMLSMSPADVRAHTSDALRVIAALTAAARQAPFFTVQHVTHLATIDLYVVGWSHLASGARPNAVVPCRLAHAAALEHGREATYNLVTHTQQAVQEKYVESVVETTSVPDVHTVDPNVEVDPKARRSVVVCPAPGLDPARMKDVLKGYGHVIGTALPLVAMPDVTAIRRELAFEYPYAVSEVDRLLSPLVGREFVHLPPTLLVGPPGAGKSRLARRLAEELRVACWRTDGSRSDGNVFGGTDRRWFSVEPCHPFLAVSRARAANPLVLVDEVDKAATRADHGRLWDVLLPFLERETSSVYPDPALQVDLDLSACSYLMTANSVAGLPAPLVDRCRVIDFPEPTAADMPSLLPSMVRDHARDLGLDPRWVEPLDQDEVATLRRHWRGGSVRRLRALLDVLLRGRERLRPVQ